MKNLISKKAKRVINFSLRTLGYSALIIKFMSIAESPYDKYFWISAFAILIFEMTSGYSYPANRVPKYIAVIYAIIVAIDIFTLMLVKFS